MNYELIDNQRDKAMELKKRRTKCIQKKGHIKAPK